MELPPKELEHLTKLQDSILIYNIDPKKRDSLYIKDNKINKPITFEGAKIVESRVKLK